MAGGEEDAVPNLKQVPIGFSWVPATPAKPNSGKQQLIYTNGQEHRWVQTSLLDSERDTPGIQVTQANLFEIGILPGDVLQGMHPERAPVCSSSTNLINVNRDSGNWSAGEAISSCVQSSNLSEFDTWMSAEDANFYVKGGGLCTNDDFWLDAANMSFLDLLALAHARGIRLGTSNPEPDSTYNKGGATSMTYRPSFDLNSSPCTVTNAASIKASQFLSEPVTPERNKKANHRHEFAMKGTSIDELPEGKNAEGSKISGEAVMELHMSEKSCQAVDQLSVRVSMQLQEKHKPDKGGTEEVDSIRTPQQKPRRKKHRPKVRIDAQQRRTPKSAKKATILQEMPKSKRTYARRKVLNDSFEGDSIKDDINEKTSSSTSTPVQKRKYTRRKEMYKSEGTVEQGTTGTTDMGPPRRLTRSSCRRSLNFKLDDKTTDESSSYHPPSNCDIELQAENLNRKDPLETLQIRQVKDVQTETNDTGTSHELGHLTNHLWEKYLERHEQESSTPSSCRHLDPQQDAHNFTKQIVSTRGKCQIVFSHSTHDKEEHVVQVKMNTDGQTAVKSPTCSIFTCLDPEIQVTGPKMQYTGSSTEELCNRNQSGAFYNSFQAYLPMLPPNEYPDCSQGLYFPQTCKRKRTEKGYHVATSSWQTTGSTVYNHMKLGRQSLTDSSTGLFLPTVKKGPGGAQPEVTDVRRKQADRAQNGKQTFEDLLALGPTEKIKRRRSKCSTRLRDLTSLPASPGGAATTTRTKQYINIVHAPHTCMEAIVAGSHLITKTKKRSKRSMIINSLDQNLYGHQNATTPMGTDKPTYATNNKTYHMDTFAALGAGRPLALTWKHMSPVDSIIEQLNKLDLSAESKQASVQKQNAFLSCVIHYQEQHALVPFQRYGAVVPFDRSFEPVRRKTRPKVDLDDETTRVWRLLLENINSEGIDGTDEAKAKWWEEERRVFNGRADSFIARMHLVQGDRRFSPWKGSVVDSVVGVFLTQNVSDHLSSSAFMSLAARFPLMLNTTKIPTEELHEVGRDNNTEDPEFCVLDPDGTFGLNKVILDQLANGEDAKIHQDFKIDSLTEETYGNSEKGYNKEDDLAGQSAKTSIYGSQTSCEAVTSKQIGLVEETLSYQTPDISSQNSAESPVAQATDRNGSCIVSTSEEEETGGLKQNRFGSSTSLVKLLQMAGNVLQGDYGNESNKKISGQNCQESGSEGHSSDPQELDLTHKNNKLLNNSRDEELSNAEISGLSSESSVNNTFYQMTKAVGSRVPKFSSSNMVPSNSDQIDINHRIAKTPSQNLADVTSCSSNMDSEQKEIYSNKRYADYQHGKTVDGLQGKGKNRKLKENQVNWDDLRTQALAGGRERPRTVGTNDSVDWDAVRCADVNEIADTIKERGMNNILAQRIKDFLNRLVGDHGSIDLEWLRDIPPHNAKDYLLSFRGLGLKSVECVRLLTLHHLAFPVDTNVGRIAVRLGWVPLQPLPESLQLHLLELYPVLESIQKYLWPRLCKLDQRTLYELHYQMITFGKVFCTKSKPNCNACPMRAECRHFASAFASARLALPAPEEKRVVRATYDRMLDQRPMGSMNTFQSYSIKANQLDYQLGASNSHPIIEEPPTPEPIIEVPATPEPVYQVPECDIEDAVSENPDEIPTIQLNMDEFTHNLQKILQQNTELEESDMSKALVALTSEAASIPVPKLKNVSRLRTEHQVYELPDSHPLLEEMKKREPDDPSPYLLAIWTPGETASSVEPPQRQCGSQDSEKLCPDEACSACNNIRETNSQTVRGTILIPCRTAMRGSFPLNGTYFQVNEVFSDHESSLSPIVVPRKWLWNLPKRTVYFGTSIPTIFRGLTTEGIQYCFWRGFVCVRGFERKTRAPRPLLARFHFPASKLTKGKGKTHET